MILPPSLARPFRIVAFVWESAVGKGADNPASLRGPLERLLRAGVQVMVIADASTRTVERRLAAAIRGPHKRRLYLATSRGTEISGFDEDGRLVRLWKRTPLPQEEQMLAEVGREVHAQISLQTGLDVQVLRTRTGRQRIDLVWLQQRAEGDSERTSGGKGSLSEVFQIAQRVTRERGLLEARLTSGFLYVDIGLADKGDAIAWILRERAAPAGISPRDILVIGDRFGPFAGTPGSDAGMMIPAARGAAFVSVGLEAGGTPLAVIHLDGGLARLRALLRAQAALYPVDLPLAPTSDPEWTIAEEGFVLAREHEIESLFAVGNGYLGTRGSLAEGTPLSAPAMYVAGAFELPAEQAPVPALVRLPGWTTLAVRVDAQPVRLESGNTLEHRRVLDMRQGILWREWRHRDPAGRITSVRGLRLASQADRRLLLQSVTVTPENYSGRITFEGPFARQWLQQTNRGTVIARSIESLVERPEALEVIDRMTPGADEEAGRLGLEVEIGKTYRLDRVLSVASARNDGQPLLDVATAHLEEVLRREGVERMTQAHREAWLERWRDADVCIDGDAQAQRALRFAIYHMLSAVNPDDEHASIGARALTGGAYKGHVFWDTEIFVLPFFIVTYPPAARALLMYRYHTLPAARAKAAHFGYRGAMYAWESADTGEEATPPLVVAPDGEVVPVLAGSQEQHISADVAYAVWSYWQWTGDEAFLLEGGAQILLETARFWASRVEPGDGEQYHIRGVIGPDEYHETVDDNAYTNVMAQWNLERGAEVAALLSARWPDRWRALSEQIEISPEEPPSWRRMAANIYTGFNPESGLFEQFRGYFDLEHIDLKAFEQRAAPMDVLLGRERVRRSQVIKQADVVMLIWLLWDRFSPAVREANFHFYEPLTGHGSSLSPGVHALVAARLGDLPLALRYFRQTGEIDLANNMGNAAGGVHIAAMGGLWQAAVFGFAGLTRTERGLELQPHLPSSWRRVQLAACWRGHRLELAAPLDQRPRDHQGVLETPL